MIGIALVVASCLATSPPDHTKVIPTEASEGPRDAAAHYSLALALHRRAVESGLPVDEPKGLADMLKPGQIAVSIKVNPESLKGGAVLPGSRADVISTVERGGAVSTTFLLQDVLVLAVGDELKREPGKKPANRAVTLAATNFGLFEPTGEGFRVRELAPGVTLDEVRAATGCAVAG